MSIGNDLIERLGRHDEYMKDRRGMANIDHGLDEPDLYSYSSKPFRFNHRYALRHSRRIEAASISTDRVLSKDMLLTCHSMANPIEIWSDPDTNDQICRLLLEDDNGNYDHERMNNRAVRLVNAIICDFRMASRRYNKAGIFFRSSDPSLNIRIINYLLPFSIEP